MVVVADVSYGHMIPGLVKLEDANSRSSDIFVSPDMIGKIGEGTTDQFQSEAAVYDARYFDIGSKLIVLNKALSFFPNVDLNSIQSVLDIGCGSGNTTFALLEITPNAQILASDISLEMLNLLIKRAAENGQTNRIVPFVSDAQRVTLAPDTFDLIVGSSMIHHLLEPDLFVDKVLRALKPGGIAIFLSR